MLLSEGRPGAIPSVVANDRNLDFNSIIVFSLLTIHMDKLGICTANSKILSETLPISKRNVERGLKVLNEFGYICFFEKDIVTEMLEKGLSGKGIGNYTCSWCQVKTDVLDEHHYPIPRSLGGIETVLICPNCHAEYHRNLMMIQINKEKINIEGTHSYISSNA